MLASLKKRLRRGLRARNGRARTLENSAGNSTRDHTDPAADSVKDATPAAVQNREALLHGRARKRWNATIQPQSKEFKDVVNMFGEKLSDPKQTIRKILDEHFTAHERDLVVPADKTRNKALARIQKRNRLRYETLLKSPRFASRKGNAGSLKVKLAMLWFGMPVAPLSLGFGESGDSGLDSDSDGDTTAMPPNIQAFMCKERNEKSLRFLNSYGMRHFGTDDLRAPDMALELYYAFNNLYPAEGKGRTDVDRSNIQPISLRGGGISDDWSDMDVDDFNESDMGIESLIDTTCSENDGGDECGSDREIAASGEASLRGGAATTSSKPLPPGLKDVRGKSKSSHKPNVRFGPDSPSTKKPVEAPQMFKTRRPSTDPYQRPIIEEQHRSLREAAYTKAPSVYTNNTIPDNAPPVEKVLRFGFDNLPVMSAGILTPTEQRQVQLDHYALRNIALERSQKCPYRGCSRVFSVAEDARLQAHLVDVHEAEKCNFCDEVLYRYWTENQRRAHFLAEHSRLFVTRTGMAEDNSFTMPSQHRTDYEREARWTFCARCGRNHDILDIKADRVHHDNVCYQGNDAERMQIWDGCVKCGAHIPTGSKAPHYCQQLFNPDESPYCDKCALPLGLFSDLYRATHQLHCRGQSHDDGKYCPWCGIEVSPRASHINECSQRPDADAEGPVVRDRLGSALLDLAQPLGTQMTSKSEVGGLVETCSICKQPIAHLDPLRLMKHMEDKHNEKGGCVFCKLDYKKRGWDNDRQARLMHVDDHLHERKVRLAADLVLSMDMPADHPLKNQALRERDYEGLKDMSELISAKRQHAALWKAFTDLNAKSNADRIKLHSVEGELAAARLEVSRAKTGEQLDTGNQGTAAEEHLRREQEKQTQKPSLAQEATRKPEIPDTAPKKQKAATTRKRKGAPSSATVDPSYRPRRSEGSESESHSSEVLETTAAEVTGQAQPKKKPANPDPSFRPDPAEEAEEDEEETETSGRKRAKKTAKPTLPAVQNLRASGGGRKSLPRTGKKPASRLGASATPS